MASTSVSKSKKRIFYRTKKPNTAEGSPPMPPVPAVTAKDLQKNYLKSFAVFQCQNDRDHTWKSAHAWKMDIDKIDCEKCNSRAKVLDVKDEMCSLVTYMCTCKSGRWVSLADPEMETQVQKCDVCELDVIGGVQERMATHFWYKCLNKNCETEWEDANIVEDISQRCRRLECFGRGRIIGMRKETPIEQATRRMKATTLYVQQTGPHDIPGCEMCQKFIKMGKNSCRQFKKVELDYDLDEYGNLSSKIVWMSK